MSCWEERSPLLPDTEMSYSSFCGVCGSHGDNSGPPHDLVDGGPGVGQLSHVIHARKTVLIHHCPNLLLDPFPHLWIVNHEEDGPLQGRLQSLDTSGENVEDDLLELSLWVLVEHLLQVASLLGTLHLNEVRVHEVPWGF